MRPMISARIGKITKIRPEIILNSQKKKNLNKKYLFRRKRDISITLQLPSNKFDAR